MKRLAIIGSGIAGMGPAFYLKDDYEITIFEKNEYVGGHTNTINTSGTSTPFYVDTGFIVYNIDTYPNLIRLFSDLGVETEESDMSFSVFNAQSNLQWAGSGLNTLFAQRSRVFSPSYWKFLREAMRFWMLGLLIILMLLLV